MNNTFKITLIALFSFLTLQLSAQSPKISIQSTLKSITGDAVEDGLRTITFKLYHDIEGGPIVWQETADVDVTSGIYSHKLGSSTPLIASDFGENLYLGVTVDGKELSPRTEMTYAPYALSVGSIAANGASASFGDTTTLTVSNGLSVGAGINVGGSISCLQVGFFQFGIATYGKVGIGTLAPEVDISINDIDSGIDGISGGLHLVTDGNNTLSAISDGIGQGRIGINNSSPDVPLHVRGNNLDGTGEGDPGVYIFTDPTVFNNEQANLTNTVAFFEGTTIATGGVVAGQGISTWSDNRIKNIIKRSDGLEDLSLLNEIEITDYEYIDKVQFGNAVHKKLIAQQVQEIMPIAVTKMRLVTPSVYESADKLEYIDNGLSITTVKAHEFIKGDHIDLKTSEGDMHDIEVLQVINAHTFMVKSDKKPENVFVYGKYIDDFLAVDYDAVSMLNVSASQEMYKMIIDLQKANARLVKENESLGSANANIEDRLSKIESLLATTENSTDNASPSEEK